jgi:hemolysin III
MGVLEGLVDGLRNPCEPVSSMTHLGAAVAAAVGAFSLVGLGGRDRQRTAVLTLYVFSVVVSMAISGFFHSAERGGPTRDLLQRLDHYAIWLLIAVAFTAIHGIACRGFWRWGILCIVWAYGLTGIALQMLWFDVFSRWPGLGLYLGMGWIGIASIIKLGRDLGFSAVRPLIHGGLFFTFGALAQPLGIPVLVPNWLGPHELFHVAVIVGMFLQWRFIRHLLLSNPAFVGAKRATDI